MRSRCAPERAQPAFLATRDGEFLFDVAADLSEVGDLKHQHAGVLARMKDAYATWERGVVPPIPLDPQYR